MVAPIFITPLFPTYAQSTQYESQTFGTLEKGSTRFAYESDSDGSRHFSYIHGPKFDIEPHGELYSETHVLRYGVLTVSSERIDFIENVTDDLVFPYHYNLNPDAIQNEV